MIRTPVSSSNLSSVGYEAATAVLEVEFTNGRVYQYLRVPAVHYYNVISAASPGSYFNTHIKDAFACVRL